jgi:hypothetical protein
MLFQWVAVGSPYAASLILASLRFPLFLAVCLTFAYGLEGSHAHTVLSVGEAVQGLEHKIEIFHQDRSQQQKRQLRTKKKRKQ